MKPQKTKITDIRENENNPRFIKDLKFKKLVKSIKEFPKMLEIRPIVVNENNVILGGNMRYKASIEAGLKEVWVIKVDDLTPDQQKEFIIKDNVGFGQWDWDLLANEWDTQELNDWGLEVLALEETFDEADFAEEKETPQTDEVIISLSMPYYQYEKMETDFQEFIKKYPNVICKIQN